MDGERAHRASRGGVFDTRRECICRRHICIYKCALGELRNKFSQTNVDQIDSITISHSCTRLWYIRVYTIHIYILMEQVFFHQFLSWSRCRVCVCVVIRAVANGVCGCSADRWYLINSTLFARRVSDYGRQRQIKSSSWKRAVADVFDITIRQNNCGQNALHNTHWAALCTSHLKCALIAL